MKPSIVLAIALLSGSIPLAAQQASAGVSGGQASSGVVTRVPPVIITTQDFVQLLASCPAMMSVSHLADGSMIRTGRAHPESIGQWLHVTIMAPIAASATLKVRGYSDKAHMTQTDSKNGPNKSGPDAERTVTVSFRDMPNEQAEGNVWAPGLTAVDSLYLISLTYVDGTRWNAPGDRTCRVTPDPMMPISGR